MGIAALGVMVTPLQAFMAYWLLFLIPLYLSIGLKQPSMKVYCTATAYHLFFIINSISAIISLTNAPSAIKPLLQVVRVDEEFLDVGRGLGYTIKNVTIQCISIGIGFAILYYFWRKRYYFMTQTSAHE
jgi:hypothetical protein